MIMRICTTTLLGPGTAANTFEAIASAKKAGIHDHLVIPWNADPADIGAMRIAANRGVDICGVRPIRNFGDARNCALATAEMWGYDVAVTLDTDERLIGKLPDLLMQDCTHRSVASAVGASYSKPRIFALPATGQWVGRTHETFLGGCGGDIPADVLSFAELPKTETQLRAKAIRDIELLRQQLEDTPDDARWHFYLGESHSLLLHVNEGLSAYRKCFELRANEAPHGFVEEGAWACFKGARLVYEYYREDGLSDALKLLTLGMTIYPWMPELPWYAGYICLREGRKAEAQAWADLAIAARCAGDRPGAPKRHGFRELVAHHEGPWEILAACEGDPKLRDAALEIANAERQLRPAI